MSAAIQVENVPPVPAEQQKWNIIDVGKMPTTDLKKLAYRLNGFGSLHYFIKIILRRHRLNNFLHKEMCQQLERTRIKDVIEIPRDHFKSTIYSEGAPMWWALPFTDGDALAMSKLGYSDEFIRYMRYVHKQDTRTLLVSEVIANAMKLGSRISSHYENNDLFRSLYDEILPDTKCTWSAQSLHHKRTKLSVDGEGTYDFIGVGAALQSRHYDRVVQDDLVGRDAIGSEKIMEDTVNYHRLLAGAFDSSATTAETDNDELVVGNRWAANDLNAWIRANEDYFKFTTHSALGGCCPKHPLDTPIFPEEFSKDKLRIFQTRFGAFYYSCQMLNNPIPEGATEFKTQWLRYYELLPVSTTDNRATMQHEVKEGEVIKDMMPGHLSITMIVDPNHAGNKGRCRHAITVIGINPHPFRIYLLDSFAESCSHHALVDEIFKYAAKWKLRDFWLETVAAQKYLKAYIEYKSQVTGIRLKVRELKIDTSPDAKDNRIRSMNTFFEEGQFWCRRNAQQDFILEYETFPYGKTKDILDTVSYAPQTWRKSLNREETTNYIEAQRMRIHRGMVAYN